MRNFFALFGAGTIAFVGLGWYLGWYNLSRQPGSTGGTQRFQVDLNPNKITTDVRKGIERGAEIYDRLTEDKQDQQAAPAAAAPSTTGNAGPASQFFAPPTPASITSAVGNWKSLDVLPSSNSNDAIQPVSVNPLPKP